MEKQKYEAIEVTDWRKLKVGDKLGGRPVRRIKEVNGKAYGIEVAEGTFCHESAQMFLEAHTFWIERPVAEEPKIVTFEAQMILNTSAVEGRDTRHGEFRIKVPESIMDWYDGNMHVTATEKPHTAIMGKIVAEAVLGDREVNQAQTVNGGGLFGRFVEDWCKPGMKVIIVDESAEVEL